MSTRAILERLIAFDTVSHKPNAELMAWVGAQMQAAGARLRVWPSEEAGKVNLLASFGPEAPGGVILSAHTDVVPVEGQAWSRPPFCLTEAEGRLYGRGTADMKGFVAAALAAGQRAAGRPLRRPLHIALSHDEEVGCIGVRPLLDRLAELQLCPALCLVGEPTGMAVATGHKGKTVLEISCRGRSGHSALAPQALNALHLGAAMVGAVRAEQARLAAEGARDPAYAVPWTTLHVGRMEGGAALNIVPDACRLEMEIRALAEDDPQALVARLRAAAGRIVAAEADPDAAIEIAETGGYPGLATPPDSPEVRLLQALSGATGTIKVAYGTEGGLYAQRLGVPVVICGPGHMAQGHRPDEFVEAGQLARCDAMLDGLLDRLEAG